MRNIGYDAELVAFVNNAFSKLGQSLVRVVRPAYYGRTAGDAKEIDNEVVLTSRKPLLPGQLIDVRIIDAFDYDLTGEAI